MDSGHAKQLSLPLGDRHSSGGFIVRAPRTRVLLGGKLVHSDGAYTIDCVIRDISAGGAKIVLSRHQSLPPELYLIAIRHAAAYRAKVAWAHYPARGLQFSRKLTLDEALPAELKFLRHLWVELSARPGRHN